MSLILEALRKSEAERQAAGLPGLVGAPPARAGHHGARRRGLGWWLVPLSLAVGLGAGWWLFGREGGQRGMVVPEPPVPAVPSTTPQATGADGPPAAPAASAGPALPLPAPRRDTALPPAAAPSPPGGEAQTAPPVPASIPPPLSPPAPVAPPPAPPQIPDAAPLSRMPAAQRAALPPLRLSVHVFNDEPARRFVVIDGRRMGEGEALAPGLTVREIRRQGVLLDVHGQPWLLEALP
ncbi:MAG: hypothetical protein KatS3mg126_0845 [Lysobacteraceae bacterium]|nr:MAG: hypothetical protein KatS3mg126_0845 [Xanthomonadaceae bacterium]